LFRWHPAVGNKDKAVYCRLRQGIVRVRLSGNVTCWDTLYFTQQPRSCFDAIRTCRQAKQTLHSQLQSHVYIVSEFTRRQISSSMILHTTIRLGASATQVRTRDYMVSSWNGRVSQLVSTVTLTYIPRSQPSPTRINNTNAYNNTRAIPLPNRLVHAWAFLTKPSHHLNTLQRKN